MQAQSLRQTMMEKEAGLQTHEKQLLQDLEESQAGERHLRNSLQKLEAEVSQLHLSLHSTESRAEALAAECHLASDAHHEAQSQLARLHSLLQHIRCGSTDLSGDLIPGKCNWRFRGLPLGRPDGITHGMRRLYSFPEQRQ